MAHFVFNDDFVAVHHSEDILSITAVLIIPESSLLLNLFMNTDLIKCIVSLFVGRSP